MVAWYVDGGLARLISQWRTRKPGAIVGTIGDAAHQGEYSEHNPESDGSVDAGDFMKGNGVTNADLDWLAHTLANNRDKRLFYVIWQQAIFDNENGTWAWRYYDDDFHDHVHVSVNDNYESDNSSWNLGEDKDVPLINDLIEVSEDSNEALFGDKLPAGTKRPASTFLQLAGIHAARSAKSSAEALVVLKEIRDLLKAAAKK